MLGRIIEEVVFRPDFGWQRYNRLVVLLPRIGVSSDYPKRSTLYRFLSCTAISTLPSQKASFCDEMGIRISNIIKRCHETVVFWSRVPFNCFKHVII